GLGLCLRDGRQLVGGTFDDLVQLAAIEPHTAALGAVIDFDSLPFGHDQVLGFTNGTLHGLLHCWANIACAGWRSEPLTLGRPRGCLLVARHEATVEPMLESHAGRPEPPPGAAQSQAAALAQLGDGKPARLRPRA